MNKIKTYFVTTTANTRGKRITARDARAAKTIFRNITGFKAGNVRKLI